MEWEPIAAGGYTRARKWRVTLDNGTRLFAKEAPAGEIAVYETVDAGFLPSVHEVRDGILLLEDLSEAHWPPPYPDDTSPLLAALEQLAATPPPAQLPCLTDGSRWQGIASEPRPLVALGLCSADWLDRALPSLIEAEARVPMSGDALVHYDIWARNLCFADRGVVLVDWAMAHIGNARIDLAFVLLSLLVEGARIPPVDDEPALAAYVTGVVATEASLPPPEWAAQGTNIREDQKGDLAIALPWVAQQIGCPLGERKRR